MRSSLCGGERGEESSKAKWRKGWKEEGECGEVTAECGSSRYKARLNRRTPEPSPEAKRRPRLVLTAQSMTWGPRPTCRGEQVTNKGAKRRDLNQRPRARSEAEAELTCAYLALAWPSFSGTAPVVNDPFTPAARMPSVARVTRCTTVRGGHESISHCDVMRQPTIRWMVKAGQDLCSKKLQAMQSQIVVVAPPAGSYLPQGGPGGHCRYPVARIPTFTAARQDLRSYP